MVDFILTLNLLVFSLALEIQCVGANYVIFGGTPTVVRTRLDPIVNPGAVGGHVHDVFGGNGFSETYDYNQSILGNCTTIPIPQDFSNYWVPSMYYVDPKNGSYTQMKSVMNIYYLIRPGPNNDRIYPFPTGLRMFAGNNERGTYNASNAADQAVSYVCLDYQNTHTNDPAWAEREDFFAHQCPDGMRAQVFFPSCWDGKNLDSPDHVSHMSYPIGAYNDGYCPDSHPVHLISLFYELIAPTGDYPYNGPGTWSFSNGDTQGLRYHGDFTMGWKDPSILQEFIDNCPNAQGNAADCPAFASVMDTAAPSACQFEGKIVDEDIGDTEPISQLPGCNSPWNGTGPHPTCPSTVAPDLVSAIQPLPSGWSDLGCIAEPTAGRALVNTTFTGTNVTRAVCATTCDSEGFMFAGVEYGNQCYCGNELMNGASQATVPSEKCNMRCAANMLETCGGPNYLELLYSAAPGSAETPAPGSNTTSDPSNPAPWTPGGCVLDGPQRALTGFTFSSDQMTPASCQEACSVNSYTIAGLESGSKCYCGNSLDNNLVLLPSNVCNATCSGDATAICGGSSALSIYRRLNTSVVSPAGREGGKCKLRRKPGMGHGFFSYRFFLW